MKRAFFCATIGLATAIVPALAQRPMGTPQPLVRPPAGSPTTIPGPTGPVPVNWFSRGQIVNNNAKAGMITVRTGTGTSAREQQFRIAADARLFGPDRRMLKDGLNFNGFRTGTDVWFRSGTGATANSITDLRLFDPMAPAMQGKFSRGQIVNVDPRDGFVTIRNGTGANVREQRFRVGEDTRFFGPDLLALNDGLGFNGFRNGADVWFLPGSGQASETLSGISLADPIVQGADQGPAPVPPGTAAANPPAEGRFARGIIELSNPKTGDLTLRMGTGADERELNFRVTPETRYFGADRQPITGGLSFRAFRIGADVWFRTSTGDARGDIIDIRLYEPLPAAADRPMAPAVAGTTETPGTERPKTGSKFVSGKIVTFDADSRVINVQTGTGPDAKEQSFRVASDAEFFGPERQPISEGLRFPGLKPGVDVWLRVGTGDLANTVRDLRMYDPGRNPDDENGRDKPKREPDR